LTSERKIRANRANARASTGPKSRQGRARALRNALRHGLNLPVCADPALAEEVEALTHEIAGSEASAEIRELARQVAEAQIDLRRVRYARQQLLSRNLSDPDYRFRSTAQGRADNKVLDLLRRFAPKVHASVMAKRLTPMPPGPQKLALILSQEAPHLLSMDRYEQRALRRRNSAIRDLELMRRWGAPIAINNFPILDCILGKTKPK
jgi:hypothetical protein